MKKQGIFIFVILAATCVLESVTAAEENCPSEKRAKNNRFYDSHVQRLFDQDFGLALTARDFLTPLSSIMSPFSVFRDYYRPWRHELGLTRDVGSTIKTGDDKFQISLDVQHFSPDELTVKTADGYIVIEAKHEEKRDDHGYVSRHFVRRYALPEGVNHEEVLSELSSDGVLTVTAPRIQPEKTGERTVPIVQTGPVRKTPNKEEDSCDQGVCISNE